MYEEEYSTIADLLGEQDKKNGQLNASLQFWEKKRLSYNILTGIAGVAGIIFGSIPWNAFAFAGIIFYGIMANAAYSSGFLLEALTLHYFKGRFNFSRYRMALLIIGMTGSVMITFFMALIAWPIPD